MSESVYFALCIVSAALITLGTRALPFALFGSRPLPKAVRYLGRVLPASIMTVLAVYCLRNTDFSAFPYGAAELISCAAVVLLQAFKKNMYLSIAAGTLCYMVLIRVMG